MNLIDKLLLVLLIVIGPLGLVGAYVMMGQEGESLESTVAIDEAKLEELAARLSNQQAATVAAPTPKPFMLASVGYASQSGELVIKGKAPEGTASVMVTATVLPTSEELAKLEEGEAVKGSQVETESVVPKTDGEFSYGYDLGRATKGIVELRLEQGESVKTVRFDLETRKQLL